VRENRTPGSVPGRSGNWPSYGDDRPYVWAEIGAAWGRRIPIIGILYGLTATELQTRPGIPVFLKKRDLLDINGIDVYFQQLKGRVAFEFHKESSQ
jgi:hypothetical protein